MIRLAALLAVLAGPALACGEDTDCVVGDRIYRISGTEHAGNGALVFAHGYRGSAAGVMRNGGLKRLADELGVALIALQGVDGEWKLRGRPRSQGNTGAEEYAYVEAVLDDAARFGLNRNRVVATGFSAGGMLTWNLACSRSDLFAGFIPMSGTFWDPVPASCNGPVASIVHIHGTEDSTVPVEGRVIADSKQGDVEAALIMYEAYGSFGPKTSVDFEGGLSCKRTENATADILTLCTFEGGHSFRLNDLRVGWDFLVGAGRI